MSTIAILTEDERLAYDYPPILTAEARALCFCLIPELESKINRLRTSTNKVGFLLQYGYFKVCKRFFLINRFRQEDIDYVARLLGISPKKIQLAHYKKKMPIVHQDAILQLLEYQPLDDNILEWLECELQRQIKRLVEPRKLFFTALHLLHDRKIALPSYHFLSEFISRHYVEYENNLLKIIETHATPEQREKLQKLIDVFDKKSQGKLNKLKTINQSLNPKAIQASVEVFKQINNLFDVILPLITELQLTPESCHYYAIWVKKAKLSQLKQFPDQNRLFLHLIAFCQHQYYLRQDAFVDITIKSVQSMKNTANARINKSDRLSRKERREAISHITQNNTQYRELIDEITEIVKSTVLTDSGKLQSIKTLLLTS